LVGDYKEDLLTQFAERNGVDLIAMIKRDRGFWKNLFHRSLTKSMSFYCDKPLLILRD
jgi:nucleotide-binding universal stress UspA family protein